MVWRSIAFNIFSSEMGEHKQFGKENQLSIHINYLPESRPANLWLGKVWLTIRGTAVGNTDDRSTEQIGIALSSLSDVASRTGQRSSLRLQKLDPGSALKLVMSAVYGDDKFPFPIEREAIAGHELMPYRSGPASDGWEAIIVENQDTERFIWRSEYESAVAVHDLPKGSLWAAVEEANEWLSAQIKER